MGNCSECGKEVKGNYPKCYPCNQKAYKAKTQQPVQKSFTPQQESAPQKKVYSGQAGTIDGRWHPIITSTAQPDGTFKKLTVMVNFVVPDGYKAFVGRERNTEKVEEARSNGVEYED